MLGNPGRVLEALGVVEDTVFRKVPKRCIHCECKKFDTLEVVGLSTEPLFYECLACGTLHLKYKMSWVEKQFANIEGLWTNPNDWDESKDPDLVN